ncbi:MAG: hypothetical protein JW874_12000, partial [Spirochaetales bacterium]|nr:hypothetical protein [Spirochaetales bacterium]
TIELDNGTYNFAIIDNDRTLTFPVRATGTDIHINIRKAPPYHQVLLYTFIASTVVAAVSFEGAFTAENVDFGDNPLSYIGISGAVISLGSLIWWISAMPGIQIKYKR